MLRRASFCFAFLSLVWLTACSDSSTSPTPTDLSGTWTGTLTDSRVGNGTARVTFSPSGTGLSGTWSSTFPDPSNNNSGTLSGSVNGSSVMITLTPSVPISCPFQVTATVAGNQMTGTYAAVNCSVPDSGSISLSKSS